MRSQWRQTQISQSFSFVMDVIAVSLHCHCSVCHSKQGTSKTKQRTDYYFLTKKKDTRLLWRFVGRDLEDLEERTEQTCAKTGWWNRLMECELLWILQQKKKHRNVMQKEESIFLTADWQVVNKNIFCSATIVKEENPILRLGRMAIAQKSSRTVFLIKEVTDKQE